MASNESKTGVSGGTVALDPASPVSVVSTVGTGVNTFSLGRGVAAGQRKTVVLRSKASTGNAVIAGGNLAAGATITLSTAGQASELVWSGSGWAVTGGAGVLA